MTTQWIFEPTDPGDAKDPRGQPWEHAVNGVRPDAKGRTVVTGYGHTQPNAERAARHKADLHDAEKVVEREKGRQHEP